jgi:uncharacterized protein (TIGR02266 family)
MNEPEKKKATLLVVDDDADLREAICFDLKRRGYKVLAAASGREAIGLVMEEPIDMVISDIRMPDGDGVELLKKIKEHNYRIPVLIFITGFADLTLEDAYDFGADAVLSKPFDRSEFFSTIDKALTAPASRWSERPERLPTDFKVELHIPGLNESRQSHLLNIGRGGMFVALADPLPQAGLRLEFTIHLEDGPPPLKGQGIVRWTRMNDEGEGRKAGLGLEFEMMDQASRQRIAQVIEELQSKAFIPAA